MKSLVFRACEIILAAAMVLATTATAQTACKVIYTISPQNSSAFGAAITSDNTGTTAWTSWTLTWTFANGQTVSQLWNGIETQSGANVMVQNQSYNGSVAAGGTVTGVGFNGTWNGATNAVPTSFAINSVTCGATLTITTTALAASTTTPVAGASVTLTATVAPSAATGSDNKDDVVKSEAFMEAEDFDGLDEWIHEVVIEPLNTYSVEQQTLDVSALPSGCSP